MAAVRSASSEEIEPPRSSILEAEVARSESAFTSQGGELGGAGGKEEPLTNMIVHQYCSF